MNLEDLLIYLQAMTIAQKIWDIVLDWDSFAKYTLGKQWVNAADSIGQNISEGFGRYHYRDAKNFYYYARGSIFESLTILEKSKMRKLISECEYIELHSEHKDLAIRLNNFIRTIGNNSNTNK
jgi:four helix bundle protein